MNKILLTALALTLFYAIMVGFSKGKDKQGSKNHVPAIDTANMDKNVKPGASFFLYMNGNWIKNHPVPAEYSRYGAFDMLQENNYTNLKSILEDASKDTKAESNSNKKKIGDFYAAGMDSAKIDKEGIKPLAEEFALVDAIKTKDDFQKEVAHLHTIGINPLFHIYSGPDDKNSDMVIAQFHQGGLGLADRDYYFSKDARSKDIREGYKNHLAKTFVLLGEAQAKAEQDANDIMALETKIADSSSTRLALRDPVKNYNIYTIESLQKASPDFNWKAYFTNINVPNPGNFNVGQPAFFKNISKLMKDVSIDTWKTYLKWNIVRNCSSYLSSDFEKEHFDFYGKVLSGKTKMQPRWKRVLAAVNGGLGEAVGQLYVAKYFPAESKAIMVELVNNLRTSLKERIQNLTWMSKETKANALAKLEAMNVKIGYPDKWRDYSKLTVSRESYVKNALNSDKFDFAFEMGKVGKAVDRTEWGMTPQTVNAYYSPNMNEIVFPAAILQPPFFSKDADAAVNYGAIGTVIGHEMTHGFDDQGRQFDKKGNLTDWWTDADADNFTKQTAILVDQYNKFKILDTLHVNGKLTLGENIADFGGITISLNALKSVLKKTGDSTKIDGFTPMQRFFMSFAQVWRTSIRDKEQMRLLKEDVHSPGVARTNAVVRNVPEFYTAFNIKSNDPLFIAPENRAKIW